MAGAEGDVVDPGNDIDWDIDFIWVNDYTVFDVLERQPGSHVVLGRNGLDGHRIRMGEFNQGYLPGNNNTTAVRNFNAVRAHCLSKSALVKINGDLVKAKAGDAVIEDGPSQFRVVDSETFLDVFAVVALKHTKVRPLYAYPETDISSRWW